MPGTVVAVLGLGTMGSGMAQNLLRAGFDVAVYNRSPEKAKKLGELGARVGLTPAEAARGADVVISMLADDDACRASWLGADGALSVMKPGAIVVESSTVSPAWVAELAQAVAATPARMVEAPVTGSRTQAENGELTFLVGSEEDVLQDATPVLKAMSKSIRRFGPVGSGAQIKLINNFLCGAQAASFAQAFAWVESNGLQHEEALEFLCAGAAGSGILRAMTERMSAGTYEVNFLLRLMRKDLNYAQKAAAEQGIDLSTAAAAEELFAKAQDLGQGDRDMSAVVEAVRPTKS